MSGDAAAPLLERGLPLLDRIGSAARPGEVVLGWLRAESSDFVRFNHGRVRQAGSVERALLELRLVRDARQATLQFVLSGHEATDADRLGAALTELRGLLADSQPDPWLALCEQPREQITRLAPALPPREALCDTVCAAAGDADLVGFYAGGALACGFASSLGHRLWHEASPWFFDHSVQVGGDRAVKATLSWPAWDAQALAAGIARARRDAAILARPVRTLPPGGYRAWLSPTAMAELIGMLNWGGFSAAALRSGHSPLTGLAEGGQRFSPMVSLADDLAAGGLPRFQSEGFARPDRLPLVQAGAWSGSLVSPRSAREFGLTGTGADAAETAQALSLAGGDLPEADALRRLGTGLAVSNFWYLNWSDRAAARITGMTRFATLWVEDGEPVAPVAVMRFDDSLYRLLGSELEALSQVPARLPDTQTYDHRSFGLSLTPGALVSRLSFTL